MTESLSFYITLMWGFTLGFFAAIWAIGIFLLKDRIIFFLIKKYLNVRNWLALRLWRLRLTYWRWRRG